MAEINIEIEIEQTVQYVTVQSAAPAIDIALQPVISEVNIEIAAGPVDKNYVHTQSVPATEWNVYHGLNKFPSVVVVTSANDEVKGSVKYIDLNNVQLNFKAAFSGKAYFN